MGETQRVNHHESGYIFKRSKGTRIDQGNLRRAFIKARNEAEVEDSRFHDLRHTFATRLVQAGIDLYKVQRLLGHKSPSMTQRYAHHYPESLRESVQILDVSEEIFGTILSQSADFSSKQGEIRPVFH